MNARLMFAVALVGSMAVVAPTRGMAGEPIAWHRSIRRAMDAAAETNRPVLVYASSRHCRYCREMERRTLADPAVADVVSGGFVAAALDGDVDGRLLSDLGVKAYPTIVVVMPRGDILARMEGFAAPEDLAYRLRRVSSRIDGR